MLPKVFYAKRFKHLVTIIAYIRFVRQHYAMDDAQERIVLTKTQSLLYEAASRAFSKKEYQFAWDDLFAGGGTTRTALAAVAGTVVGGATGGIVPAAIGTVVGGVVGKVAEFWEDTMLDKSIEAEMNKKTFVACALLTIIAEMRIHVNATNIQHYREEWNKLIRRSVDFARDPSIGKVMNNLMFPGNAPDTSPLPSMLQTPYARLLLKAFGTLAISRTQIGYSPVQTPIIYAVGVGAVDVSDPLQMVKMERLK